MNSPFIVICTNNASKVYAFVAHRMSRVLQLWLKGRMIALRECVSRELAQHTHDEFLVKVCARVCQVREQERQIHINTRRLLLNFLVKCFQCWALYIEKVRRGKQLLRRYVVVYCTSVIMNQRRHRVVSQHI